MGHGGGDRLRLAGAMLVLAGCGRLGFDPEDDIVSTFGAADADAARVIVTNPAGNVVIAGEFRDAIDFGCPPIVSNGGGDGFIVELTPELECVRTWSVGGAGDDLVKDVTQDRFGNYVVAGEFRQTATIGSSGPELTSAFQRDIFLTKLTANWDNTWTRQLPGNDADPTYELVNHVRVDSSGGVHVFGRIWGSVQFGWGGPTQSFSDSGWGDAFVLSISADGGYGSADMFGGGGSEHTYGMAIDDSDNVYIAGAYRGTADFDPGPAMALHSGNFDGFIEQRRPDGTLAWLVVQENGGWRPYQAITNQLGGKLATVQNDLVTVADQGMVRTASVNQVDGTLAWSREIVGPCPPEGCLYAHAIATDNEGNIYVAGRYAYSVDFDPGETVDVRTSAGNLDCFIQSYGADGSYRWTMTFGGAGVDIVEGITALGVDDIVAIGSFEGEVDFSSQVYVRDIRQSNGSTDVFVRRITR